MEQGESSTITLESDDNFEDGDFYCRKCQFGRSMPFTSAGKMALHKESVHQEHDPKLPCLLKWATGCESTFSTIYKRYTHSVLVHHSTDDCPFCGRRLDVFYSSGQRAGQPKTRSELTRSIREHTFSNSCLAIPVFRCLFCQKVGHSQGNIGSHMKVCKFARGHDKPGYERDNEVCALWGI